MWQVRILEPAAQQLAQIDNAIARRIARRVAWLAENFDSVTPEALKGDLAGLYKLRVGDHRVVYQPLHDERLLVIHFVGHRREVYRKR